IICIEHHHPCGEWHAAGNKAQYGDLPGGDAGQGSMETTPLRPELREVLFPGSDYFGWTHLYVFQANAEDFLPHLTEPLQRTEAPSSLHIQVERSTWKLRYFEDRGLLRPIRINRSRNTTTSPPRGRP